MTEKKERTVRYDSNGMPVYDPPVEYDPRTGMPNIPLADYDPTGHPKVGVTIRRVMTKDEDKGTEKN